LRRNCGSGYLPLRHKTLFSTIKNVFILKGLLEKIDHLKHELDTLRPLTPEQEGRVMQKFRLDWNYHSNAIEGNSLTYGETIAFLMEGLTAKGKPFKDHLDIRGHNEAIDFLMDLVKNRQHLSEKIIRELHQMILVEPYITPAQTPEGQRVEKKVTLGAYKSMPNHVRTPTGEIHYYATPEETPAKMSDLMAWLREHQEAEDLPPLLLAAVFHYRFVAIHPFDDGNGRMSRLLMNLLLMQYGYPPVVIKQQDRQAYYYALRQADAGDLEAFSQFIGENLVHSLEVYLRGARGESIEEGDDLDKEIALLKMSLGASEETIPKSKEIIQELIDNDFLLLFQVIQTRCRKLDDLFFQAFDRILLEQFNSALATDWTDLKENLWKGRYPYQQIDGSLRHFNYEYHWVNFKKTTEPFSVLCILKVEFIDFKYEVEFVGVHEKLKVTKLYREKLSKEEVGLISKLFVKEALGEIKAKTGK
jgi:Fic family protein